MSFTLYGVFSNISKLVFILSSNTGAVISILGATTNPVVPEYQAEPKTSGILP